MYDVTVIFTRHKDEGNCNSIELLKIVRSIQPEVVFEELSYLIYDQIYNQQIRTTLESDAVKAYLMTNAIEHVPIDTFECPDNYYNRKNHYLGAISDNIHKSDRLRTTFNQLISHAAEVGFTFLNSDQNDVILEDLKEGEKHLLGKIADDNLHKIAQLRFEVDSKREDAMIDNIYKYGAQKVFNTAIFLIGAGHRRSIKSKLDKIAPRYGVEIKWHFL